VAGLTDNGARLPLGQEVWGDTWVALPGGLPEGSYVNVFTGAEVGMTTTTVGPALLVGEILAEFPVALLKAGDGTGTWNEPYPDGVRNLQRDRSEVPE